MSQHFSDYFWKEGRPYGLNKLEQPIGITFKVISDPYFKRTSLEKYQDGKFRGVVYDSALLNFRHLKPTEQMAWQKEMVAENADQAICHIRNQDDRLIIIEEYRFEKNLCRECRSTSPQGVLLSVQRMSYTHLNDAFNGVTLYDAFEHVVMYKHYKANDNDGSFTELVKECWHPNNVA